MQNNQPIPDWLFEYVQDAREIFGIGGAEWSIHAKLSDKPGGKSDNAGWTNTNFRYFNVDIEFSDQLEDTRSGRATAIHEVGHIAMFEIDSAVEGILAQVDEDRREFLSDLFQEAEEKFLQRLARSLAYRYEQQKLEVTNEQA